MDGVSNTPGLITRLGLLTGAGAPAQPSADPGIASDRVRLSSSARTQPAGGTASAWNTLGPAGGNAPAVSPDQFVARIEQDAVQAQQSGDSVTAQRLTQFAGVIKGLAADGEAVSLLAQAYSNPRASEGATRLHELFFGFDPNPTAQLLGLVSFDGADSTQWRAAYPNNMFNAGASGQQLAASALKEIANPQVVKQGDRQTCGAASVQIMLAKEAPKEYLRLLTSLAVNGEATLASGASISRAADWAASADGGRSVASRLLQPALMDYANGSDAYRNGQDVSVDASGATRVGLLATEMQRLLAGVTTHATEMHEVKRWNGMANSWDDLSGAVDTAMARIQEMTAKGWSVPVLLSVKPNEAYGHYQMVTGLENGNVKTVNPWGYEEVMPLALFQARLVASFHQ